MVLAEGWPVVGILGWPVVGILWNNGNDNEDDSDEDDDDGNCRWKTCSSSTG